MADTCPDCPGAAGRLLWWPCGSLLAPRLRGGTCRSGGYPLTCSLTPQPPHIVLEMPPDVAAFVVAALRTYGALSAEKGLPSYTESAEALADKIDKAIWEAGKAGEGGG